MEHVIEFSSIIIKIERGYTIMQNSKISEELIEHSRDNVE